jgi:hypothetical protein
MLEAPQKLGVNANRAARGRLAQREQEVTRQRASRRGRTRALRSDTGEKPAMGSVPPAGARGHGPDAPVAAARFGPRSDFQRRIPRDATRLAQDSIRDTGPGL